MICPNCQYTSFENRQVGDVLVETCKQCFGVWFGPGELNHARSQADHDLRWLEFDLWKDAAQIAIEQHNERLCPVHQKPMAAVTYGPTDVIVDTCPECHGIWLDQGEFEKIISALKDYLAGLQLDDYEKAVIEQAEQLVKGKKKLGEEVRDLGTVLRFMQYRILVEHPKVRETLLALQGGLPTQYW